MEKQQNGILLLKSPINYYNIIKSYNTIIFHNKEYL